MPNQSEYLEIMLPDPNAINKAARASEGMQGLSQAMAKVLTIDVTSLTMPYTVPYSASEGGNKTGLHFAVLKLIGTQAANYTIELPAKDHVFIVQNLTNRDAELAVTGGVDTIVAFPGEVFTCLATPVGLEYVAVFTQTENIMLAAGGESAAVSVAANVVRFRMPYAFNLSSVKASLNTAQASGSALTIDVKANGVSVFTTLLTFDNTETTTKTATTPFVLTTTPTVFLDDDDEISLHVTQVGDGSAQGLKVSLIGSRS